MKISLNWLKEFVSWNGTVDELVELLTRAGLEVAAIEQTGAAIPKVVVARIEASDQHPNADRLSVCRVDDGSGTPRQIVCGAKNYKVGDKVPLALPGAVLPGDFKIKVGKLRGVESEGMLCSGRELGLADDADGLLILSESAEVGRPLSELFPPDTALTVEITPNRPDWLSHLGIAREVAAMTGATLTYAPGPEPLTNPGNNEAVISTDHCPYYSVRRIRNVRVGPSPDWLQRRLESVGLRPINSIVDVTNLVMFELGQPLHAFDAAKVQGPIRIRDAQNGESIVALDGREYSLKKGDCVIADDRGAIAIAGVMGGEASGVTSQTTDVLLESALFDPSAVRRTARRLGISSDSSYRFERGVDPQMVLLASARACDLITELAGGEGGETAVAGSLPARPGSISFRPEHCRALLGAEIPDTEMFQVLSNLGVEREADDSWSPPTYRADLTREVDLVEEVIRVIGIDRIGGSIEGVPASSSQADHKYDALMVKRHQLRGLGFSEARTSTLVGPVFAGDGIPLRNPLGEEQSVLRPTLISGLLAALKRNRNNGATMIRLFEIGRVFSVHAEEQSGRLALVATGPIAPPSWRTSTPANFDFFDLKGLLQQILPGAAFHSTSDPRFGIAVRVEVGGFVAGIAGQLSPAAGRDLDAIAPVLAAEIRTDCLVAASNSENRFVALPKFPATSRDFALLAHRELAWEQIEQVIRDAHLDNLVGIDLFDVYIDETGARLPTDRKSLAFSLTFRSPERTLTADEVSAACDQLRTEIRSKLHVEFRE